jgi:hypothetical protein
MLRWQAERVILEFERLAVAYQLDWLTLELDVTATCGTFYFTPVYCSDLALQL